MNAAETAVSHKFIHTLPRIQMHDSLKIKGFLSFNQSLSNLGNICDIFTGKATTYIYKLFFNKEDIMNENPFL